MAKGSISQELLDAIMQEMVGTYEVSEAEFAKLVPGPSSSPTRSQDRSSISSSRARTPTRQRSRSPHSSNRDHYSRSRSPDSSGSEEFHPPGRSRNARRRLRRILNKAEPMHPSFEDALDKAKLKELAASRDAVSRFGFEAIRWSGFHTLVGNRVLIGKQAQSRLKKDLCAKVIASFKCPLKPEHRAHCYAHVGQYKHPTLQKPDLDDAFYELLVDKGAVAEKLGFSEVINPLDKHLLSLQLSILKCAQPMLLACSEYELHEFPRSFTRAKLFRELEKTISLCRKTLVLLGMSYTSTSAFRQNKILEAVGLRDVAPRPSDFPNLEDSLLFGNEYMAKLKEWLEKSKHPVEVTYGLLSQEEKQKQALEAKITAKKGPRVADPVALSMIDYLLEYTMKNCRLKGTQKGKPQFWFMFDESTYEYKYYRLKLLEMQKLKQATKDSEVQANAYQRSPEDLANESVRAMLLARKIAAAKKRFRNVIPVRKKKKVILTKGTQTDPEITFAQNPLPKTTSVVTEVELPQRVTSQQTPSSESQAISNLPCTSKSPERTENPKSLASEIIVESKLLTPLRASELDAETKETADNLARFLVEMGPELDGFSLDNMAANPEFWFLKQKQSPAYQYFCKRLTEFRKVSGVVFDPLESYNRREAATQGSKSKGLQSHDPKHAATKPPVLEPSNHGKAITQVSKSKGPLSSDPKCPATKPQAAESSKHRDFVTQGSKSNSSQSSTPTSKPQVVEFSDCRAAAPQGSESKGVQRCPPKPTVEKPPIIELDDSDCEIIEPQMPVARASVPQKPAVVGLGSQVSQPKQPTFQDEPLVSYCSEDENSDTEDPSQSNPEKIHELPIDLTQDGEPSHPVAQEKTPLLIEKKPQPLQIQHLHPQRYLKPLTPLPQRPVPLPHLHSLPQEPVPPPPPPFLPLLPQEPPPPLPKEPEPEDPAPLYTTSHHSISQNLQCPASLHLDVKPVLFHPSNSETLSAICQIPNPLSEQQSLPQVQELSSFEVPYIKSEKPDLECEYSGHPSVDASPWLQSSESQGLELVTEEEPSQSPEDIVIMPAESQAPKVAMASASPEQSSLHRKRCRPSNGTTLSPKRLCAEEETTVSDVGIEKPKNGQPVEIKKETTQTEEEVDFQLTHIKEEPSFGLEEGKSTEPGHIVATSVEDSTAVTEVQSAQRIKE
ncbi:SURP and G-patch domain-containing protein 2-like [Pleurodeles waltl]|uniref:SURP and G-patch domain-containing protein 2-like n=1 Tax=Pleurodeles waltl TaxID=8319 RepID=UPI0037099917